MVGKDELIFTGEYKGFRLGLKYELSGKDGKYVSAALSSLSEKIEPHAFYFSGIDMKNIERIADPKGKGLSSIINFLDSNPQGQVKQELSKGLAKPELISAAESYFFNRMLMRAGVYFKAGEAAVLEASEEKPDDFIGFIGKYGSWVSIKKLGLGNVQDYEVSGILSGINHTAVNKGFDFANLKDGSGAFLAGKRKSFGNLSETLKQIEGKVAGPEDAMTVARVFEGVGYRPYASPQMLTDAYPDIKPPKTRGRKPKG